MDKDKKTPQAVFVDDETAELLRYISDKSEVSTKDLLKTAAKMLKYAMGRKIIIEGEKRYLDIKYFEKFKAVIDIDKDSTSEE